LFVNILVKTIQLPRSRKGFNKTARRRITHGKRCGRKPIELESVKKYWERTQNLSTSVIQGSNNYVNGQPTRRN
ncbi:unnamed protein product, partial [Allacma fusca]